MRRSLFFAVLIQGTGTVLAFLTTVGIAHYFGAQAQGSFAIFKNWFDLSSAMLLLGVPQGLVFVINRGLISPAFAARMSIFYSLASIPLSALLSLVALHVGYLPADRSLYLALAIGVGCGGYIYHGLIRSIFLTRNDGVFFSALTVVPTMGIFLVVLTQWLLSTPVMETVFPINGAICAFMALLALARLGFLTGKAAVSQRSPGWFRVMTHQSAHSFAQSLLLSFQPMVVYSLIKIYGGGVHVVGVFSFALVALVAVNALIAMISPILYNRWSKAQGQPEMKVLRRDMLRVSAVAGLLLTAGLLTVAPLIGKIGGGDFDSAPSAIRVLAFASMPLVYTRLWIPALLATGRSTLATQTGVVRLVMSAAGLFLFVHAGLSLLMAASFGWLLAETTAAILLYLLVRFRPAPQLDLGETAPHGEQVT